MQTSVPMIQDLSTEQARKGRLTSPTIRLAPIAIAALIVMTPVSIVVPALKEMIADRFAAQPFWTHSFMSVNMIGAILATPWLARLCDGARSRKRLIVAALLLEAGLLFAMSRVPSLSWLLAVRFVEGAAHMLALTALMAAAADIAADGRRGRVMGCIGGCMMLGTALGTRLGGLAWKAFPGTSFTAAAGAALCAALFALAFMPQTHRTGTAPGRVSSLRALRRNAGLNVVYVYAFLDRFCVGVIISTFVLFLGQVHGIDPNARSRLLVMFLLPFALLIYPAGRLVDRIGPVWPLAGGSIGFGLLFATYGLLPGDWLPLAMACSGLLSAAMFAPTLSLCAAFAAPGQRGAAFAGFNAAGSFGFVAGPIAAGLFLQSLSGSLTQPAAFAMTLAAAGATQVACGVVSLPWLIRAARNIVPAHAETAPAAGHMGQSPTGPKDAATESLLTI